MEQVSASIIQIFSDGAAAASVLTATLTVTAAAFGWLVITSVNFIAQLRRAARAKRSTFTRFFADLEFLIEMLQARNTNAARDDILASMREEEREGATYRIFAPAVDDPTDREEMNKIAHLFSYEQMKLIQEYVLQTKFYSANLEMLQTDAFSQLSTARKARAIKGFYATGDQLLEAASHLHDVLADHRLSPRRKQRREQLKGETKSAEAESES